MTYSLRTRKSAGRTGKQGIVMDTFNFYMGFYQKFLYDAWENMTPTQYGILLTAIAATGYALMKSGAK